MLFHSTLLFGHVVRELSKLFHLQQALDGVVALAEGPLVGEPVDGGVARPAGTGCAS